MADTNGDVVVHFMSSLALAVNLRISWLYGLLQLMSVILHAKKTLIRSRENPSIVTRKR